jgi:TonB family protein
MLARVRALLRPGPVRGILASLAVHLLVVALLIFLAAPNTRYTVKRGDALFVELPDQPEPAPAGTPAARKPEPPSPPASRPAPAPRPAPRVAAPAPAPAAPRQAPRPPTPPSEPPVVASRPAPPPAPPAPELKADDGVAAPKPAPQVAAAPPAPEPAPATPPSPDPPAPAPAAPPAPPASAGPSAPSAPPAEPAPTPPQVAAIPPDVVDIRSALGRGGAGGLKGGRGGIEGEPIPLDSADPKFNDFLERLRRRIKANWGFPCIKNEGTRACEYKTTSLVVEFGILKDGRLQFVEVLQSSGYRIYDDYALNAIKLSTPFPAVPASMIMAMKQGSTGVAIVARFNYVVDTSLTNLLR